MNALFTTPASHRSIPPAMVRFTPGQRAANRESLQKRVWPLLIKEVTAYWASGETRNAVPLLTLLRATAKGNNEFVGDDEFVTPFFRGSPAGYLIGRLCKEAAEQGDPIQGRFGWMPEAEGGIAGGPPPKVMAPKPERGHHAIRRPTQTAEDQEYERQLHRLVRKYARR